LEGFIAGGVPELMHQLVIVTHGPVIPYR
jgi:hypothetical protein